jgi:hypothetical protein
MTTVPAGATCYFCLGEEADEEGMPLVRDCSCRGASGFAHQPCIIAFAAQKSKGVVVDYDSSFDESQINKFMESWETCINCNNPFRINCHWTYPLPLSHLRRKPAIPKTTI